MAPRAWLILVAAAAVAGWLFAPEAQGPTLLVQPRRDVWAPPTLPRRIDAAALAAAVVGAPFWGPLGAPTAAASAPAEPGWRASGVFGQGAGRILLISFAGDARQPLKLRVGDKLPSGHRIVYIGDRDYCVRIDGKDYRMRIERSDT